MAFVVAALVLVLPLPLLLENIVPMVLHWSPGGRASEEEVSERSRCKGDGENEDGPGS